MHALVSRTLTALGMVLVLECSAFDFAPILKGCSTSADLDTVLCQAPGTVEMTPTAPPHNDAERTSFFGTEYVKTPPPWTVLVTGAS